jgi:ribosomal-protein-alanine N-acetyltransferase
VSVVPRLLGRADDDTEALTIEPMRRRHLRQAMPIEEAAYPTSWSRSVFESELDQVRDGSRHYVVARRGRQVAGYAGVWIVPDPDGDQAHVTNVVVAPAFRRQAVATKLLSVLAGEIIERGCVAWTLEVRASSEGAQELYRRFGFGPAGVRKNYYDNSEDAIVMWCHDIDTPDYARRLAELSS